MKRPCVLTGLVLASCCICATAFAPIQKHGVAKRRIPRATNLGAARLLPTGDNNHDDVDHHYSNADVTASSLLRGSVPFSLVLFTALPAHAASGSGFVLASAFAAYAHYAALLTCVGVLVTERLLVSPEMTFEEEEILWKADALYGIAGLILAVSGYYRATEYGKGWEFYAHEPLFWLKLVLVGIWGASSFFPTITILKRVTEQRETGEYPPLSQKLSDRMIQVINAELLAIGAIPLVATLMSRGVLGDDFPWQVGAGLVVLTFGGFGYKYAKEALTWSEEEEEVAAE